MSKEFWLDSYKGYELDVLFGPISDKDLNKLDATILLVEKNMTLRAASKYYNISADTLHRFIRRDLKDISNSLYKKAKRQLQINKKNASHNAAVIRWNKYRGGKL